MSTEPFLSSRRSSRPSLHRSAFVIAAAAAVVTAPTANRVRATPFQRHLAAHETVLYAFRGGSDGYNPLSGLFVAENGALLGITVGGGTNGRGTVFALTPTATGYRKTILHTFGGRDDGADPYSILRADAKGALYGTTISGGASGFGTVYQLAPATRGYIERVIYSFRGGTDGSAPVAPVVVDANGSLYGTTTAGGTACSCGTIYRLKPSGSEYSETILYAFRGGDDGATPNAGLLAGDHGVLFGTTYAGGPVGGGTVYALEPRSGAYSEVVLHGFGRGGDGLNPSNGVSRDASGALYGTTSSGGAQNLGTVYQISPSGTGYAEHLIHSFLGGSDGANPGGHRLVTAQGVILGATANGGSGAGCGSIGCGTIYELDQLGSSYAEHILYRFNGPPDGRAPLSGIFFGENRALFGTTYYGGVTNGRSCALGCGTVYRLTAVGL
jgi:uncharacterized repeat protein (TIGR03803 family)